MVNRRRWLWQFTKCFGSRDGPSMFDILNLALPAIRRIIGFGSLTEEVGHEKG
jgi:hypothetical protein